jgi:hypothetical protein
MLHTNGSYHSRDCDWALPSDGGGVELMLCACVCWGRESEVGCRVMSPRYRGCVAGRVLSDQAANINGGASRCGVVWSESERQLARKEVEGKRE